ncbi:MAG TPA: LEA type 2 family protein [Gemmatimonadaceae bacterium]|nr:LEA type 2 family protein [Gemmatimonadaceae bacterium]
MRAAARPVALAVAVAALAGCATLARQAFRTPTVDLRDVRVRALGLEGGSVDVLLDVFNPNDYRIDATKLTYTLIADTSLVAEGAVTKRVTLRNRDHNDVVLPVSFTFRELLAAAEVMTRKGSVNYTVKGEVTVDSPFGSVTRPYEAKARLDNAALLPP